MERVEMLNGRGASILKRLDEHPTEYIKFNDLLKSQSSTAVTIALGIKELENVGYVERKGLGTRITENGREALKIYKEIEKLAEQIP